jgi:hypothetical protein
MVTYAGGNGETIENAIVIVNAASPDEGVRAEYEYIMRHYGKPQVDWQMRGQALMHHEGKPYDQMNFVLNDGTEKTLYFDISEFFGRDTDYLMGRIQSKKSPLQRFIDSAKRLLGMK